MKKQRELSAANYKTDPIEVEATQEVLFPLNLI